MQAKPDYPKAMKYSSLAFPPPRAHSHRIARSSVALAAPRTAPGNPYQEQRRDSSCPTAVTLTLLLAFMLVAVYAYWTAPTAYELAADARYTYAPHQAAKMSVILPCGYGEPFAPHTVRSVFLATPPDVLHEIIVVDDAADPPIAATISDAQAQKVRILRHDEPVGLIAAKQAGADAATGDILLFLDCHVKPASNYWKPMVDEIRENYRRVVVPTITKLDVDTWTEFDRPQPGQAGLSKCYLTFDAEFKWTTDHTRYVPIMSGGLLAISRRWWRETGGYDGRMVAWGGENMRAPECTTIFEWGFQQHKPLSLCFSCACVSKNDAIIDL